MNLVSAYRKFIGCLPAERRMLVAALLLVCVVRFGLWVLPFKRLQSVLRLTSRRSNERQQGDPDKRRRIIWAVRVVGQRLLGDRPCLPKALAAQWLLRRSGQDPVLRIGVDKSAGDFRAHAWLEWEGRVILGGTSSPHDYAVLQRRPPLS